MWDEQNGWVLIIECTRRKRATGDGIQLEGLPEGLLHALSLFHGDGYDFGVFMINGRTGQQDTSPKQERSLR